MIYETLSYKKTDIKIIWYNKFALLKCKNRKFIFIIKAIITKGGTAPNIIPAESRIELYIRAPVKKELLLIKSKVDKCIIGAALSSGCTYTIKCDPGDCCDDLVTNETICEIFSEFAEKFGKF